MLFLMKDNWRIKNPCWNISFSKVNHNFVSHKFKKRNESASMELFTGVTMNAKKGGIQ
jgi:hypothetical protein